MKPSETLLGCLQSMGMPVPVSSLWRALKNRGVAMTLGKVEQEIGSAVQQGHVWEHPPVSEKAKTRYWIQSPADFTLTLIQQRLLAAGKAITIPALKSRVTKAYRRYVDEALGLAIQAGQLFEFRKGKARYIASQPPGPRELLTPAQLRSLEASVNCLKLAGRRHLTLESVLAFMDSGLAAAGENAAPEKPFAEPTSDLLREWFQADLPSLGGLRTMPFSKTWPRYTAWSQDENLTPSLTAFHDLLRDLARSSIVALTPHDEPARLPTEDQELLLEKPDGARLYYYTILS